jgi:ribosomal protein S18 acetylase RimI-like enzyme
MARLMVVQKPRRLNAPLAMSLHDRLGMESLSCSHGPSIVNKVKRSHPELIIERAGNVLTAVGFSGVIVLQYAYTSDSAFMDHFGDMFDKLLPRARKAFPADTVRFRLSHGSSRPAVEPVLRRLAFEPSKAWLQFSLAKGTKPPTIGAPRGITYREGSTADVDDLLAIDRDAFPNTPTTRDGMLEMFNNGGRVLLAVRKREAIGFALYDHDEPDMGYLRTLAVREEERGKGIGATLTARVAKVVFAEGATRLDLRTDDDNSNAIRLYSWLGFKNTGAGRDYERPADPKVIERMRAQGEGTFIKFGGWR